MKEKIPEINFLRKQREILLMQSKRMQIINNFSLVAVFSYLFFLLAFFSYIAFLKINLNQVGKDIQKEKQLIKNMDETKLKYFVVKKKVGEVKKITDSLYKHQEIIQKTFSLIPEGVLISGMSVNENGEINFSVSTDNPVLIKNFLTNVEQKKGEGEVIYYKAETGGIRVDEEGLYSLSIKLNVS